jgi:dynein heavy chain 1
VLKDTHVQLSHFDSASLQKPFAVIENKVRQVATYVGKWLQFQSLWDLEADAVYAHLGDSLADWQQLLGEIRKTRSTFDNSESQRSFGVAVVKYEQVQAKVNAKYDAWQRDILARFGAKLGTTMRDTHTAILKARQDLEQHSIEGSSTAQAVAFITFVQDLKRKVKAWAPEIELFGTGQKTLERQRYQFANDWLYVDQVEGEWGAFNDILTRKNASIQDQMGASPALALLYTSADHPHQPGCRSRSWPRIASSRIVSPRHSPTGSKTSPSRAISAPRTP